MQKNNSEEIIFKGIPVSEGVSIAKILKLDSGPKTVIRYHIQKEQKRANQAHCHWAKRPCKRQIGQ